MPSDIKDIALVLIFLLSGTSIYFILDATVSTLSHSTDILIMMAAGCRIISIVIYRFYREPERLRVQENTPSRIIWQVFEWALPFTFLAELIVAACGIAPVLGDGNTAGTGLF